MARHGTARAEERPSPRGACAIMQARRAPGFAGVRSLPDLVGARILVVASVQLLIAELYVPAAKNGQPCHPS
jgi:hypothetical protein